jgi:hypothetical protein
MPTTADLEERAIWRLEQDGYAVTVQADQHYTVTNATGATTATPAWTARVEARYQVYQSVFDYPTMTEAQAWVEQKIEALLRSPRSKPH